MGSHRQLAIELLQDISAGCPSDVITKRLAGKSKKDLEQICSVLVDGHSVLQAIASKDRADLMEFILKRGVDLLKLESLVLHIATSKKAQKMVTLLLSNNASPATASVDGKTPLHIASELGNTYIVEQLLQHGAKDLINIPEVSGCTALTLACMAGHRETVKLLLDNGGRCDIEAGFPPLHAASLMGNVNIVQDLLEAEADVNQRDRNGETPLHYASYKGHKKVVEALLKQGAKSNCMDLRGKRPADMAKSEEVRRLLVEASKDRKMSVA